MQQGACGCIRTGFSQSSDPVLAAEELFYAIDQPGVELAVFFCSIDYDLDVLGAALAARFAGINLIGCTSAGEITPLGYSAGSIVGFSLAAPDFVAVSGAIHGLSRLSIKDVQAIARDACGRLHHATGSVPGEDAFAFLLIDGQCRSEEQVVSSVHWAIGEVPLFGGSAGSNLSFGPTFVYHEGGFHDDSAVLALVRTSHSFKLFTHHHFVDAEQKMVITAADPVTRLVTEINAEPAGREYARVVGLDIDKLTPMIFATHPVMVKVGGRYYARSIQKVNDDESLTFFCAIDKGIVLTVARGTGILENLKKLLAELRAELGQPQLIIACDCILRGLELERSQLKSQASRLFAAHNVIGLSTYGEQFRSMHVNQTFTGVAIGADRR